MIKRIGLSLSMIPILIMLGCKDDSEPFIVNEDQDIPPSMIEEDLRSSSFYQKGMFIVELSSPLMNSREQDNIAVLEISYLGDSKTTVWGGSPIQGFYVIDERGEVVISELVLPELAPHIFLENHKEEHFLDLDSLSLPRGNYIICGTVRFSVDVDGRIETLSVQVTYKIR